MMTRRNFVRTSSGVVVAAVILPHCLSAAGNRWNGLPQTLEQLERNCHGRLGVAVLDTASGETSGYRQHERFAMCSTFKMLLAAAVLKRVDAGKEKLERAVPIQASGFLGNSPITQWHAGGKMTVAELCQAAATLSDNTAANMLLATIGGPAGLTAFARSLGDTITRLDRVETSLNEARPGDPRDTTSPEAMVADWHALLIGLHLAQGSRKQLTDWLIANQTGGERLRKGVPSGWIVGDKTGSNGETTSNDVAVLWPGNRPPLLVAAYLTECPGTEAMRNDVLANVGRAVVHALQSA